MVEWGLELLDRLTEASGLTSVLGTDAISTMTAAQITDIATQLREFGDEQATTNLPAAAADLNAIMVDEFYYPLADAVDGIASAIGDGNMAGALTALQATQEVTDVFADNGPYTIATDALTTACPAEVEQMNAAAS